MLSARVWPEYISLKLLRCYVISHCGLTRKLFLCHKWHTIMYALFYTDVILNSLHVTYFIRKKRAETVYFEF